MSKAKPSSDDPGGERLDIDWEFWDAQLETLAAIDSGEYDIVVFRGGFGSGKTVLGARAVIRSALDVPKSDNLILAPDSQKGGPATYKAVFEQLPGEDTVPAEGGDPENSPIVANYHGTKQRLTLFNGSVLRLGSADRWNRYAGSEFNLIWADEVGHYENTDLFKLNEMLISRQRTERGPNVSLWTSTGNGYNDFWQFTELQELPSGEPVPARLKVVVADSRNNPFLPEQEKLARQFEGTEREAEALEGGFSSAEGLVYERFSREQHVRPAEWCAQNTADAWRIYGYDAGYGDPRVVLEIGRTPTGVLVVLDHFYREESQPEDVIDPDDGTGWLADKPLGEIYSEHVPAHVEKFESAGWSATNAIKDIDDGIDYVQGRLRDDGEHGPGLLVSESCGQLIREFMSYQESEIGSNSATDHALDSLRYALYTHEYTDAGGPTFETRDGMQTSSGSRRTTRSGSASSTTRRTR